MNLILGLNYHTQWRLHKKGIYNYECMHLRKDGTLFPAQVKFEISDNATGVDKDIVHKIFEPFFTTKEVGVGMGMGLSLVHSIVTSFEGQINVKENQMGGATFRMEFPVAKP